MDAIKDLFNIVFFASMSIVAILSYRQAKKTLFSPIKAETIKRQIDELQGVLAYFNRRNNSDFDDVFDIKNISEINCRTMHFDYVECVYPDNVKLLEGARENIRNTTSGFLLCMDDMESELASDGAFLVRPRLRDDLTDADKQEKWKSYSLRGVQYTEDRSDSVEELRKITASPLLPTDLIDLVYEFTAIVSSNLELIGTVVDESAHEMLDRYPTAEGSINFAI